MSELFTTEVDLPAPAEEVFRHLTDPAAMVRWIGQHATLRPVPGGAFEIDINGVPVRGHYLELDPPRRVLVRHPCTPSAGSIFLGRLALAVAGQDPGPDPWHQTSSPATDQDKARIGHAAPPQAR